MTQLALLRMIAVLLWVALGTPLVWSQGETQGRPNIVIIYADDHAEHAISAYGSRINRTPHIDQLAAGGMRFRQSFVANSICGPARATLLTGLHSHANGQTSNRSKFRDELPTFAKCLKESGYATAMIGKWHISTKPNGFDYWAIKQGNFYNPRFETPTGIEASVGHATDVITDRSVAWMRSQKEKPFLIWVSHSAAHRTWTPATRHLPLYRDEAIPEPATLFDDYAGRNQGMASAQMRIARDLFPAYDLKLPVTGSGILDNAAKRQRADMTEEQRAAFDAAFASENAAFAQLGLEGDALTRWNYQRYIKNYLRSVAGVDDSVGRIRTALEEMGIADNTIVIYSSDQGFFLGDHGWYDKRWMYEESLRTPLIVRWPGVTSAGAVCDDIVQNIDMAPTVIAMAGQDVPGTMQGKSLVPLLEAATPKGWRDAIYYHYQMIEPQDRTSHLVARHYGIRTKTHKLIYFYDLHVFELYDLVKDPHELNNLAGSEEHAALLEALKGRLRALRAEYGDATGTSW